MRTDSNAMKRIAKACGKRTNSRKRRRKVAKAKPKKVTEKSENMSTHLLMTISEVMQEVGLGRTTLWHKWTSGQMPKPLTLGHRTVRFRRADIETWIQHGCKSAAVTKALKEASGK